MDDRRIDILGDSLELPEELSALTGEFPSRPTILPDELRGALLLPSDSGTSGSFSERRTGGDDSSLEDLIQRTMGTHGSLAGSDTQDKDGRIDGLIDLDGLGQNSFQHHSEAPPSVRSVSEELHVSQVTSPAPSSEHRPPSVGLSGASMTANSLGQSHSSKSKSDKSRDWSLSDTDLKELLDQGNEFQFATPLASNLVVVPEAHEFHVGSTAALVSTAKPRHELLQGVSVLSSPSQSCSHETSGSASSRNQGTTLGHSPPQSSTSGSKSVVTNWSSATRHSAVMSSSISTIGGRGANPTQHAPRSNDDILESSITSTDSNLL